MTVFKAAFAMKPMLRIGTQMFSERKKTKNTKSVK